MNPEEQKAFWNWMRQEYGWWAAENYATNPLQPFTHRELTPDDPYYQRWVSLGRPEAPVPTTEESIEGTEATRRQALMMEEAGTGVANEYAIVGLEDYLGRKGYITRVGEHISYLRYNEGITEATAARLGRQLDEYIARFEAGEVGLEELPFFQQLTRRDYPQWSQYVVKKRKQYYGQLEDWAADIEQYKAVSAQAEQDYQAALAQWQSQAAETWEAQGRQRQVTGREAADIARSQQAAGAIAETMGRPEEQRFRPGIPDTFDYRQAYQQAAGGLEGFTAQRWAGGQMGEVWREFEQAFPGALGAWMSALQPQAIPEQPRDARWWEQHAAERQTIGGRLPELPMGYETYEAARKAGVPGMPTPTEEQLRMASLYGAETARKRATELRGGGGIEEGGEEPSPMQAFQQRYGVQRFGQLWEQYLQQHPFMEQYVTVPRQQRGFYPTRSVARARWFT